MSSVRPRRALIDRTVVLSKSTQQQKGEAIRTKLYGKYGKLIVTAVKEGGGADPVANTQLARVLADASRLSVPRDLIERNIKRATDTSQADYMELTYEAYGAGGVGIVIEVLSDNVNRAAADTKAAINKSGKHPYSRYGSSVHKQVYIYGGLDTRPTEITRGFGMTWSVGGWLLFPFLMKIGRADTERLRQRVVDELKTTFASHYTKVVSLTEALDPANLAVYAKRATGEKFLIDPHKDK